MVGLADAVRDADVMALLIGRSPRILDADGNRQAYYEATIRGIAAEVELVTGPRPRPDLATLAIWCVSLGVAASLDVALYPEQIQNPEDGGRADDLRTRYLGVLANLRTQLGLGSSGQVLARPTFDPAGFAVNDREQWWRQRPHL